MTETHHTTLTIRRCKSGKALLTLNGRDIVFPTHQDALDAYNDVLCRAQREFDAAKLQQEAR